MREQFTLTQPLDAFLKALEGRNFSPKTIRAHGDDLSQFIAWLKTVRVDWEHSRRLERRDVGAFLHHLSGQGFTTGVSRVRKLAAPALRAALHLPGMASKQS